MATGGSADSLLPPLPPSDDSFYTEDTYYTPRLTRNARAITGEELLPPGDFTRGRNILDRRHSAPELGSDSGVSDPAIYPAPGQIQLAGMESDLLDRPLEQVTDQQLMPPPGQVGMPKKRARESTLNRTIANTPKRYRSFQPTEQESEEGEEYEEEEEQQEEEQVQVPQVPPPGYVRNLVHMVNTANEQQVPPPNPLTPTVQIIPNTPPSTVTAPIQVFAPPGQQINPPLMQPAQPQMGQYIPQQPIDQETFNRRAAEYQAALEAARAASAPPLPTDRRGAAYSTAGRTTGTSTRRQSTASGTSIIEVARQQPGNRYPFGGQPPEQGPSPPPRQGYAESDTSIDLDRRPELYQSMKHMAKPIKMLANPELRDQVQVRERISKHLNEITPLNVQQAIDYEFQGLAGSIEEHVTASIQSQMSMLDQQLRKEIEEVRREKELLRYERAIAKKEMEGAKYLMNRVERLEENEKISSRIHTEKKDGIYPNLVYPSVDADEDLVRKSIIALTAAIKVIHS